MKTYIGLDIGGTKAYGGLITSKGDIIRAKEVPSRAKEGNAAILEAVIDLIEYLAGGTKFEAIGIGLAGHVDHVKNRIAYAGPNFIKDFKQLNLVPNLFKHFRVPVVLENDANVYGLGEAVFGAGKGYRRVVAVTLGTGIGGAIIQDKHLVHGKNNLAGEIGQMHVRGTAKSWEKIAAGGAFNRHGDLEKGAALIAEGLANVLYCYDPDVLVIGGGLSRETGLVTAIKKKTRELVYYPDLKKTPILKSRLLRTSPILGAMLVVRGTD